MRVGYIVQPNQRKKIDTEEAALVQQGCQKIYVEGLYQTRTKRIELRFLIAQLEPKDIVYTQSLHSFGTKIAGLRAIITEIKNKKADLITLDGIIDTRTPQGTTTLEFLVSLPDTKRQKVMKILHQKRKYTKHIQNINS